MPETIYGTAAISQALAALAERIALDASSTVSLIGIQRGGAAVADALQLRLECAGFVVERGNLDISFYRDDLDTVGPHPEVHPSELPFDISGKTVWLVDDVLYTGRTIRAALGEIFDYGRPARVRLAVLVDRGGRELPISADAAGLYHEAPAATSVKLLHAEKDWRIVQKRMKA